MIPTRLEDWTLEAIQAVADSGVNENDIYDFKADLQPADHQRKIVAAFANTRGGFLVFGVTNDRRLEGVPNSELPRDFGVKLKTQLEPAVEYRFRTPLEVTRGRSIFVVEVPRSPRVPHAVSLSGNWTFLKRTAAGNNDPMTYEEIREAFRVRARGDKLGKLRFVITEMESVEKVASDVAKRALPAVLTELVPRIPTFDLLDAMKVVPEIFELFGAEHGFADLFPRLREALRAVEDLRSSSSKMDEKDVALRLAAVTGTVASMCREALPRLKKYEHDVSQGQP